MRAEVQPVTSGRRAAAPRRGWFVALALWVGSFLAVTLAFDGGELPVGAVWAAAGFNAALGVAAVWCYVRLLRRADELERRIQVEALAIGFGAGAVGMMAYRILERAGAPAANVNDALLVMLVGYALGIVAARRWYA